MNKFERQGAILRLVGERELSTQSDVVEALRDEGLDVRLVLLERRPNREVRDALRTADVVAEQFLVGYGLLAVEAMASGAAVISNLGWLPEDVRRHPAIVDSPIVDANPETLTDRLRELVIDPERRARLGTLGREYVMRWHSDTAAAATWRSIVDAVWAGSPLPEQSAAQSSATMVVPPDRHEPG